MQASEIRQKFIQFFERHGHQHKGSSSLVPHNDPTLLFTNAGMVQFKDEFTGLSQPNQRRVVTVQKCVRAGGKHNDLENVGFTARHHTFFEMLGNFSFGDYFKKEAISMAWEFLTKDLGIPGDRLYVTAHESDQETADIWHLQEGIPRDRIFFRGDKDNFWEMGEIGPCGPCSEIFYDHGPEHADPNADTSKCLLDDESRYVEIWNLVFMQFERFKKGDRIEQRNLPKPSVDTGSGLERVAAVMQGQYNNYDTDLFSPILEKIASFTKLSYQEKPQWYRVVADHSRAATLLLSDGVIPSNEGRGYVLRRIIRRAIRHLDLLGVADVRFFELVPVVFSSLGALYAEGQKNQDFIQKYLRLEEENFRKTLASGLKLLEKKMTELKAAGESTLGGEDAFLLYDSHGFPMDLTEMILRESQMSLDSEGFSECMERQKARSKKGGDFSAQESNHEIFYRVKEKNGETQFVGYSSLESESSLWAQVQSGENHFLVFDKTPFYAEGGGQAGDKGWVLVGEKVVAEVLDTTQVIDGLSVHRVRLKGELTEGGAYRLRVNKNLRESTKAHHTATHLLQAALIRVLGSHVKQAGSSVGPGRLRFDFTHPESLSSEELRRVETLVNDEIQKATDVCVKHMTRDEAMQSGAMALFGEKYGSEVRVIDVSGFSLELCGGTHVSNTREILFFKIASEGSLSSGVRRIEAFAGMEALNYLNQRSEWWDGLEGALNVKGHEVAKRVNQLQESMEKQSKEIRELKDRVQSLSAKNLFDEASTLDNGLVFQQVEASEADDLRKLGDLFTDKHSSGVVLITQKRGDKLSVLLKRAKESATVDCAQVLKTVLGNLGGRGGGKPDMSQGSLSPEHHDVLVTSVRTSLQKL